MRIVDSTARSHRYSQPVHLRRYATVLGSLIALGVVVVGAEASSTQAGRPPGSPDLAAMALTVGDLPPGARIDAQRYYRDPDYVASYERDFEVPGTRLGRSRLVAVSETLDVERTVSQATTTFSFARVLFSGRQGARLVKAILVEEGIPADSVAVGRIRQPRIGHGAIYIPITFRSAGTKLPLALVLFRFDRVLGSLALVGFPRGTLYAPDAYRLTRVAVARVTAGLVPVNVTPPTVTGTAQPGQVLTAARGMWSGDQLTYAYQWERCLPTGSGCVAIAGATAATYTPTTGDLASSLRVTVTARNRLRSASSSSAVGAAVAGPPGSPVATVAPEIAGTPAVGSTLTASTGSWSGDPTSFAFQWRRCDAAGACGDVSGATASTYVPTTADAGRTLRVLVVATNAVGPSGSISAPTAAVP